MISTIDFAQYKMKMYSNCIYKCVWFWMYSFARTKCIVAYKTQKKNCTELTTTQRLICFFHICCIWSSFISSSSSYFYFPHFVACLLSFFLSSGCFLCLSLEYATQSMQKFKTTNDINMQLISVYSSYYSNITITKTLQLHCSHNCHAACIHP